MMLTVCGCLVVLGRLVLYVLVVETGEDFLSDVERGITHSHWLRENVTLGGDDHGVLLLGVEFLKERVDGVTDLVQHYLLLLSDLLLLLSCVVLEIGLLLRELLALLLSHTSGDEAFVYLVVE